MKEQSDTESEAREQWGNKFHGFKKKGGKNKGRKQQSTADDLFRGVGFSVGRKSLELYLKAIKRLVLYVSTQFKRDPT